MKSGCLLAIVQGLLIYKSCLAMWDGVTVQRDQESRSSFGKYGNYPSISPLPSLHEHFRNSKPMTTSFAPPGLGRPVPQSVYRRLDDLQISDNSNPEQSEKGFKTRSYPLNSDEGQDKEATDSSEGDDSSSDDNGFESDEKERHTKRKSLKPSTLAIKPSNQSIDFADETDNLYRKESLRPRRTKEHPYRDLLSFEREFGSENTLASFFSKGRKFDGSSKLSGVVGANWDNSAENEDEALDVKLPPIWNMEEILREKDGVQQPQNIDEDMLDSENQNKNTLASTYPQEQASTTTDTNKESIENETMAQWLKNVKFPDFGANTSNYPFFGAEASQFNKNFVPLSTASQPEEFDSSKDPEMSTDDDFSDDSDYDHQVDEEIKAMLDKFRPMFLAIIKERYPSALTRITPSLSKVEESIDNLDV